MSGQMLSIDHEFRYMVQWFYEWSELQREDFVPILVEFLLSENKSSSVCMNGLVNSVNNIGIANKPMSLFQCRVKLFREWSYKWPSDYKQKLQEKIAEIDAKIGEKVKNEIKAYNDTYSNGNSNGTVERHETVTVNGQAITDDIVNAALAIINLTEESIMSDNRLVAMLNNETSVDDDDDNNANNDDDDNENDNANDEPENVEHQIEPVGRVQEEHAVAIPTQTVLNNSAEVSLIA